MKGYKAFNNDLTCRGFRYEVGKEYVHEGEIEPCRSGCHFCKSIADCYNFYVTNDSTRICEVEATGNVKEYDSGIKFCTDRIKIIREIVSDDRRGNTSVDNSGYCNSGDRNSGDRNSGDWNSGDRNSGIFCTETPKLRIFDQESKWSYDDWFYSFTRSFMSNCPYSYSFFVDASDMTDEEKDKHPEHKVIGGYVKTVVVTEEDKQKWWDDQPEEDRKKVIDELPNFDAEKFYKCTGIKVKEG